MEKKEQNLRRRIIPYAKSIHCRPNFGHTNGNTCSYERTAIDTFQLQVVRSISDRWGWWRRTRFCPVEYWPNAQHCHSSPLIGWASVLQSNPLSSFSRVTFPSLGLADFAGFMIHWLWDMHSKYTVAAAVAEWTSQNLVILPLLEPQSVPFLEQTSMHIVPCTWYALSRMITKCRVFRLYPRGIMWCG